MTTTPATQALLPVTPEPWCIHCGCKEKDHAHDGTCPFPPSLKTWTPEGQAHSLPGDVGMGWRTIRRFGEMPLDGTWFAARCTAPGYSAVRIVHYADRRDRLPIDHSGWVWPSVPTEWMPLDEFAAALTPSPCPGDVGMREALEAVLNVLGDAFEDDECDAETQLGGYIFGDVMQDAYLAGRRALAALTPSPCPGDAGEGEPSHKCRLCKGKGGVTEEQGHGVYVGLECPDCGGHGFSQDSVDDLWAAMMDVVGPDTDTRDLAKAALLWFAQHRETEHG